MQITITVDTTSSTQLKEAIEALQKLMGAPVKAKQEEAAPAPAPAARAAAQEPEEEPEEQMHAKAQAAEEADVEDLKTDAVARAKELVRDGESKKVREALAAVGAKRVTEIPDKKIAEFMASLED